MRLMQQARRLISGLLLVRPRFVAACAVVALDAQAHVLQEAPGPPHADRLVDTVLLQDAVVDFLHDQRQDSRALLQQVQSQHSEILENRTWNLWGGDLQKQLRLCPP